MFYQTVEEMSCAQREIISEVIKLIKLIVLIPATNASSEEQNQRSVASKCRIITYLTSNLSQQRLTHCMILHIHKESTGPLPIMSINFDSNANGKKFFFDIYCERLVSV